MGSLIEKFTGGVAMLGEKIETLRKDVHMTQTELSRVLGVSKSAVSMYESSKRQPEYSVLCKLAGHFNVSVDYLLGHGESGGSYDRALSRAKAAGVSESELLAAIDYLISTKKRYKEEQADA